MERTIALIGFGEAARAFAPGLHAALRGYDRRADAEMHSAFAQGEVVSATDPGEALLGTDAALSLVTADQALAAARAAGCIPRDAFWFDMNSVAPDTKRAAGQLIAIYGARYIDVAVMAPVYPQRTAVPLLVSGADADEGATFLRDLGFANVRVIEGGVGAASAVKMIRSVMVKGIEALSAECVLAADAAGVRGEVIASLNASWPAADWASRFDYNLDRMMTHGIRRAAEMGEVVATLDALGTGSAMSRGTIERQRAIGSLGIAPPPGLDPKLKALAS